MRFSAVKSDRGKNVFYVTRRFRFLAVERGFHYGRVSFAPIVSASLGDAWGFRLSPRGCLSPKRECCTHVDDADPVHLCSAFEFHHFHHRRNELVFQEDVRRPCILLPSRPFWLGEEINTRAVRTRKPGHTAMQIARRKGHGEFNAHNTRTRLYTIVTVYNAQNKNPCTTPHHVSRDRNVRPLIDE